VIAEPATLARRVGERLRARRSETGGTLAEVAGRAGISVSYLSSLENGHNLASLPILARVAAALGTSLNELLRDVGAGHAASARRVPTARAGATVLSSPELQLVVASLVAMPGERGRPPVDTSGSDLFVYVIEGELEVTVAEVPYQLRAGDSLDAETPSAVRYRVGGDERVVSIWASAPVPGAAGSGEP
jgi:transcriptional regulator with XRE-family HTH domain